MEKNIDIIEEGNLTSSLQDRHYFGTISSLFLIDNYLLVGNGNILKILDFKNSKYIFSKQIFEQSKITRIKGLPFKNYHIIFIIGESEIKYFFLSKENLENLKFQRIKNPTNDFIVDIYICHNSLIIGYVNNFIDIFEITITNEGEEENLFPNILPIFKIRQFCPEKCIVYSMNIIKSNVNDLVIASGTVFRNIIVWKINLGDIQSRRILFNLKGHEGVVFNLYFSDLHNLLSVSDDRTANHWILNYENSKYDVTTYHGHSARIWDGKLDLKNNILVTVSEDCTGRVYDLTQKILIKELSGAHLGKNIRCLEMNEEYIFTAGEDWQIVKWNISAFRNCGLNDKYIENPSFKENLLNLSLPEDENSSKAREKQKNFSPAVKVLKFVKFREIEYILIGTNHGEVLMYDVTINTEFNNNTNYIVVYRDFKLRVINSIDFINSENNNILLIGLSDGYIGIVNFNKIYDKNFGFNLNFSEVEIFRNIRLPFIYHKYVDSENIILILSTPLGTNKVFLIPVYELSSIHEILFDNYNNNAATIITGSKNPLQICSAEVIPLNSTSGEYIVLLGDFGGNLYFTNLKKIGHRFFAYSDVKYLKIHSDNKISYIKYHTDDNLLYTCGRDGKIKKFLIQKIQNNIAINISDNITINEVDCKTRNDISSCELLYKDETNFFLTGHHGRDILLLDYNRNTIFYCHDIKGCNRAFDIVFKSDGNITLAYAENRLTTLIKIKYNSLNTDMKVVNYNTPLHGRLIHSTLLIEINEKVSILATASEDTKINFYMFHNDNLLELNFIDQFTRHSGAVRKINLVEKIVLDNENNQKEISLVFCSVGASSESYVFKLRLYFSNNCFIKHSLFFLCDLTQKQHNFDTRNMACDSLQIFPNQRKYLLAFSNTLGNHFTFLFDLEKNEFKPDTFNFNSLKNSNFIPLCLKILNSRNKQLMNDEIECNVIFGLTNGIIYFASLKYAIHKNIIEYIGQDKQYKIHEAGINDLRFHGRYIFTCGEDNSVIVSHLNRNDDLIIMNRLYSYHSSPIKSINLLKFKERFLLLSAGYDQNVNLIEFNSNNTEDKNEKELNNKLITTIKACTAEINSLDVIVLENEKDYILISSAGQGVELFKFKLL